MAENEARSSGESEPENEVFENEDIGFIHKTFIITKLNCLKTRIFTHQSKILKVAPK